MQMNTSTVCLVNIHCVTEITASPALLPVVTSLTAPRRRALVLPSCCPFFATGIRPTLAPHSARGGGAGSCWSHRTTRRGDNCAPRAWKRRPEAWRANHSNARVRHFLPSPTPPPSVGAQAQPVPAAIRPVPGADAGEQGERARGVFTPAVRTEVVLEVSTAEELTVGLQQGHIPWTTWAKSKASLKDQT